MQRYITSAQSGLGLKFNLKPFPAMASINDIDEENPNVTQKNKQFFGIFKDPEPGLTIGAISMFATFMMTNMFVYGLTGKAKLAYLISIGTIPLTTGLNIIDQQQDYEKWKELRAFRSKSIPERFQPYRCKYDWTEFEKRELLRKAQEAANKPDEE
ncbi:hypothetical protein WR25_16541 [Diploscapter pachys]|uniref:Uncharacterized protein n=1 Tax=Diploscapter pachys TaxID=2018661 RepID=A0A2A2JTT6_9BILA|nr:hypothetical protein WR25_16541 [Diploscapter pachys]